MNSPAEDDRFMKKWWFISIASALIALRFLHFGEAIDDPHAWRQCDTANYIWAFYTAGIDIVHPQVCWMGGHKTLALEFPLPYALIALLYKLFGPSHVVARFVFLLAYTLGAAYFYKIAALLFDKSLAQIATLVYLSMPLGLFYSRALHIDFTVMLFVFGMTYHFLVGIRSYNTKHILFAGMFASLAFLTKIPYVVPVIFPLAYFLVKNRNTKFILKSAWVLLPPVVLFLVWQKHTVAVNDAAPDWSFIPTYRKFVENAHWYYGTLAQRLDISFWEKIGTRLVQECASAPGAALAILGLLLPGKNAGFIRLWAAGAVIYVMIFFNLNFHHNYYQIPFLGVTAILMAHSLLWLKEKMDKRVNVFSKPLVVFALFVIMTLNISYAESNYYIEQPLMEKAGQLMQEQTGKNDLVIFTYGGLDPRCPLLLYRARRNGWSIPQHDLNPKMVYQLMQEGATKLAIIRSAPPDGEMKAFTDYLPGTKYPLIGTDSLYVFDLKMSYFRKTN